eukprot:scpid31836/ scgid17240/ 
MTLRWLVLTILTATAAAGAAAAGSDTQPVPVVVGEQASCSSDSDCQLNGVCVSGSCKCDPGWQGKQCGVLKLVPIPETAFFRQPGLSTWGGSVLYEPTDKLWHMWHSEIAGNCTLSQWRTTSQIRHATAPSAVGPWTPHEVVVTPEAHNPQVLRLADGTLLLFDSYGGYDTHWTPCKKDDRDYVLGPGDVEPPPCNDPGNGNLTIHVLPAGADLSSSTSWQRRSVPINYPCRSCNLTPSPVLINGTVYLMLHCDTDDKHNTCDLVMVKATDPIKGPYAAVSSRVWNSSEAPGHPEDPGMWVDRRGNWHVLLHNGPHGLHLWSGDGGMTFHTSNTEPFPFTVNVTVAGSQSPVKLARRERPVMVLDEHGLPSVLVTSAGMDSHDNVFTMTQMIDNS